jgi:V/A-type H+-transporting ATPase subunit A
MGEKIQGRISAISGPVIEVVGSDQMQMLDMVRVGKEQLIGEVIALRGEKTVVQVYESTTGLKTGEEVVSSGTPMSVLLGPGLIGNIFDGIERPLGVIKEKTGNFIGRGTQVETLDSRKKWETHMLAKDGDSVSGGAILAEIQETPFIVNKVMVPPGLSGTVEHAVSDGTYQNTEVLAVVRDQRGRAHNITMCQSWPIRTGRPYHNRLTIDRPLITGQRIIDSVLPIAKGGAAAIPGGFGTGKTMTQHQLAKWCDADLIVYIGCGERGNEMTQVLDDFSKLIDPRTQRPLMDRTILIANTSNMPVAAREASIYTGISIAEYYRDMGYHVAIMADSTSRWAEALREISGRLEEMPAEEGFPAYLSSRLSAFYERAGYVENLNGSEGSVTIIGAVSPQGSDFSEPVTQNTKRFVRCFWALDKSLAYARHYPAINWLQSYSDYLDDLTPWYSKNVSRNFIRARAKLMNILQEESKLNDIVKLIGSDVLPDEQKLTLDVAKVIRQGFLQQNAFHENDTYVPMRKQYQMMDVILHLADRARDAVLKGVVCSALRASGIFEKVIRMKYDIGNEETDAFDQLKAEIDSICGELTAKIS